MAKNPIDPEMVARAFGLLTKPKMLVRMLPLIDPKAVSQPELRWTLSEVQKYHRRYNTAPTVDVLQDILHRDTKHKPEQKELIADFLETLNYKTKRESYDYYLDVFERFMREAYYARAVKQVAEYINDGDTDAAEEYLADLAPPRLNVLDVRYAPQDFAPLFEKKPMEFCIATGIKPLDDILVGGLRANELGIWLAPTGYGKSFALVQMGYNAWSRGMNVIHFSFENSEEETLRRYLTGMTGEDFDTLVEEGGTSGRSLRRLDKRQEQFGSRIAVMRLNGLDTTAAILKSHIYNLADQDKFTPNLIVVDYGDLMRPSYRGDNKYEDMQAVFAELRDLAADLGLPLWTATQSNRQGLKSKKVKLDHISESLGKAMTADVIISISRPDKDKEDSYDDDDEFGEQPIEDAMLRVLKFRRGEDRHKPIHVKADFARSRFVVEDMDSREATVDAKEESVREKVRAKNNRH